MDEEQTILANNYTGGAPTVVMDANKIIVGCNGIMYRLKTVQNVCTPN